MRSRGKLLFATIAAAAVLSVARMWGQETPSQDPDDLVPIKTTAAPSIHVPSPEMLRLYADARPYMNDSPGALKSELGDLYGVKFDADQSALPAMLEAVGGNIMAQMPRIPNLLAREDVAIEQTPATSYVATRTGRSYLSTPIPPDGRLVPQDWKHFEYLILAQHLPEDGGVVFDESRHEIGAPRDAAASPRGTGFGSIWLIFLSGNLAQSHFRHLGKEIIHHHPVSVLGFAQDPALVIEPGVIQLAGSRTPLLYQGIAWIDDETSRILRIRTDLLAPLPKINLQQVTSVVNFSEVNIPQLETPLWLPKKVEITWNLGGNRLGEIHQYSAYHLFRATSRILPN